MPAVTLFCDKVDHVLSRQVPVAGTDAFMQLCERDKTWVRTVYHPLKLCIENHFSGDKADFVDKWQPTNASISKFKQQFCAGDCEVCGIKKFEL
jgi:hypothetical protein